MSQATSLSTRRRYGLARVCAVWEVARSTTYEHRRRARAQAEGKVVPRKRGPKTALSDEDLTGKIREVLEASPFVGEGYRKVWARLRHQGVRTSKARVLRLMREANLLAPTRAGNPHGPKAHDGTITTDRPDEMWGSDATQTMTLKEGNATIFVAVDHCTAECVGIHAAKNGNRFEALEPIRQGVASSFGSYERDVAEGLALRHDHGSQYTSDHFQKELRFLGIESSPAYVKEPEGNGCAERFIRTLKEQLIWVRIFETVEELRLALLEFKERYNREWLIERHGHRSPAEVRRAFVSEIEEAA